MTAKGEKKSAATVDIFLCPFLRTEFVFSFFLSFFFFSRRGWNFLPAARNNTGACLSANLPETRGLASERSFDSSSWGTAHRPTETEEDLREDRLPRWWWWWCCPGFCFFCCWWISEWRKVKLNQNKTRILWPVSFALKVRESSAAGLCWTSGEAPEFRSLTHLVGKMQFTRI